MSYSDQQGFRDHFLIAMPTLREGFFAQSITYLCDHSPEGAIGIVINQPMGLSLQEIFDHLEINSEDRFDDIAVLAGGPVSAEQGFVLHSGEQQWPDTLTVSSDASLSSCHEILEAIATGNGPKDYLVALGYAGWGAGQLEYELSENSWLTVPADSRILFHTAVDLRLSQAVEALGIDMNLMSTEAGHA